jgi:hypothetical protein
MIEIFEPNKKIISEELKPKTIIVRGVPQDSTGDPRADAILVSAPTEREAGEELQNYMHSYALDSGY